MGRSPATAACDADEFESLMRLRDNAKYFDLSGSSRKEEKSIANFLRHD
jgi:hypothetical protein